MPAGKLPGSGSFYGSLRCHQAGVSQAVRGSVHDDPAIWHRINNNSLGPLELQQALESVTRACMQEAAAALSVAAWLSQVCNPAQDSLSEELDKRSLRHFGTKPEMIDRLLPHLLVGPIHAQAQLRQSMQLDIAG